MPNPNANSPPPTIQIVHVPFHAGHVLSCPSGTSRSIMEDWQGAGLTKLPATHEAAPVKEPGLPPRHKNTLNELGDLGLGFE